MSEPALAGDDDLAACFLLLDSWLWMGEVYTNAEKSLFKNLAALTSDSSAPALQLAHCIRDLAFGDESRTDDLVAMVRSEEPEMRRLLEESLWRLTPEEEARERKQKRPTP